MKRSVMIVEKIKINIGKIWILILFMIVLMVPSMLIKAEGNKQVPAIIESFKINNTKEECNFTYNLEEATEWMSNITGIKKNGQIIPMSKCIINTEGGTIIIKTALSENDKISISAEGYQDVTFVIQGEHLFNTVWKHDENTHWKECMVKGCGLKTDVTDHSGGQASCQKKAECEACGQEYGELEAHNYGSEWKHDETSHWRECQTEGCTAKTDVAKHSGGQATCQQKAECEVCNQEYGEFGAHNYGSEWKHDGTSHWRECQTEGCTAKTDVAKHSGGQATYQKKAICSVCKVSYGEVKKEDKATKVATQIKKLDVKVSNLTMKKISEVQAVRKAYNVLSKKEKDTIKKEVSTLTKAETLIKQNNCGTNVYYRFSNNTLTIFGKGAMKNCFTGSFTSKNIKSKIKNRIYQKYASKVVNVVVEQGVTKIGNGAFACMPKLKTARIQGSIGTAADCLYAIQSAVYEKKLVTMEELIKALSVNLEKVTYVNGKGTMEFACFAECKKLKNIVIAEGVSAMDKSCFANCKKLKKVELPTTLKSIGEICFFGCSNVTVTIKGKITKCDVYAFYKVRNCKIVLKTAAAKKGKKVLAKALKKGKNKTVKIK